MASQNRTHASDRGKAVVDIPGIPTSVIATEGAENASIAITANVLGGAASTWTVVSNPGSVTATGTSPVVVGPLTAGTAYTFTARGNNSTGNGEYSSASNSVTPTVATAYESIATVTVGSGGASTVDFTSIPSTYKHLQIRGIARSLNGSNNASLGVRFNSDSGNNYPFHQLAGDGSSASAAGGAASDGYGTALQGPISSSTSLSSTFAGVVIDILDYANTNKYKTLRGLAGFDYNGSGQITLRSSMWMSTSATTSLSLFTYNSGGTQGFAQYTQFALYGVKG